MKKIYIILFMMMIPFPSWAEVLEEGSIPAAIIEETLPAPETGPRPLVMPMGYGGKEEIIPPDAVIPLGEEAPASEAVSSEAPGGSGNAVATVNQINGMPDGANVVMVGEIIFHKTGTDYIFQDTTGAVDVKIDTRAWDDLSIDEVSRLKITGYIDKNYVDGPKVIVTDIRAEN